MKRCLKYLFLIALLVSCPMVIKANECDNSKYACAICVYRTVNGGQTKDFKYVVKSDGTNVTYDFVNLTSSTNQYAATTMNDKLSPINFTDSAKNTISCIGNLSVLTSAGRNGVSKTIYLDGECKNSGSDSACVPYTLDETSYTNGKKLYETSNSSGGSTSQTRRSCTYRTSEINGKSSSVTVTGYINVNGNNVTYSFTDGYAANPNVETLSASLFKDSCPSLYFGCGGSNGNNYCTFSQQKTGGSLIDGSETSNETTVKPTERGDAVTGCAMFGGTDSATMKLLSWAFKLIRLGIPILIVVLGMVDFLKVLLSGEEKVYKESFTRFAKRLGIGMAFLFVPYILYFVFRLSGVGDQYNIDNFYCGIIDQVSGAKGTAGGSSNGTTSDSSEGNSDIICTYSGKLNGKSHVIVLNTVSKSYQFDGVEQSSDYLENWNTVLSNGKCRSNLYVKADGQGEYLAYYSSKTGTSTFSKSSSTICTYTGKISGKSHTIVIDTGSKDYKFDGVSQSSDYLENWNTVLSNGKCRSNVYVKSDGQGEYLAYYSSKTGTSTFSISN